MSQRCRRKSDPTGPYLAELIKSFVTLIVPLLYIKLVQLLISIVFSSDIPPVANGYILISDIFGILIFFILNVIVLISWIKILWNNWIK